MEHGHSPADILAKLRDTPRRQAAFPLDMLLHGLSAEQLHRDSSFAVHTLDVEDPYYILMVDLRECIGFIEPHGAGRRDLQRYLAPQLGIPRAIHTPEGALSDALCEFEASPREARLDRRCVPFGFHIRRGSAAKGAQKSVEERVQGLQPSRRVRVMRESSPRRGPQIRSAVRVAGWPVWRLQGDSSRCPAPRSSPGGSVAARRRLSGARPRA